MPAGVAALARLGIHVTGAPFRGVRYHHGGRAVAGEFPGGHHGVGIRRLHLDAALFEAASREPNVQTITGLHVEAPLFADNRIAGVRANGCEFRAPLTVAADGANSVLRHKLGWDASRRGRRHALLGHFAGAASEWVEVYLEHGQEVYVTPLPSGERLVAALADAPRIPPRFGEPLQAVRGAAPLTVRASQRFAPGCVLLGDAAGNCDPITGGGISQALLSAELLAGHIDSLESFDRAREAMLANYRRLTAGVLALAAHPRLLRPALSFLGQTPGLFSRLLGIAGGSA
jgi:2-polyprenyl-6-methoxyphenol hydroxylase-like FAD-dependent oxidoreductase